VNTMDIRDNSAKTINVIDTNLANCLDCYRCVRACPVKAIRVTGGHARVVAELCIQCGTCVSECPQHAKFIYPSLEEVKTMIASGDRVVASVAPSFPAAFPGWRSARIPQALRRLGFYYVSETADGAQAISIESQKQMEAGSIFTACPAVVRYIEQERPSFLDRMIPVVSPMIGHARILRQRLGDDIKIVFIGPCAAKKQEILRPENKGDVQAVLTFTELVQWFDEEGIDLEECPEESFDGEGGYDLARLFPLEGGMLKTCGIEADASVGDIVHPCGVTAIQALFDMPASEWNFRAAEPLFCAGGCIGGPGFPSDCNLFQRRSAVLDYVKQKSTGLAATQEVYVDLSTSFAKKVKTLSLSDVSDAEIERVLAETGKAEESERLNCGACGYRNCREKAAAIALGLAEASMCIPQMRRLAERKLDHIIELSPVGIVVLDEDLHIVHMNPAFRDMFLCTDLVIGREISYLIASDSYEEVARKSDHEVEAVRTKYGKRYHEIVFQAEEGNQYIGFYLNLSKIKLDNNQMGLIREQTVNQAKELLHHQIEFAQNIAQYLGESTAESEALVKRMIDLYEEKS
ncbi:MAG TPA: [Fe-Fe] hydrogenase large subunit C-terminal domain-containing protein, partial [Clostridia bacterium]|nr:[Fe-Fe] hydrogenase large subunit C-terminal domain-containing protein [Clostridia bacterium]